MRIPQFPEPGVKRVYGLVTLVNTLGFGLVITSMALYFTRGPRSDAGRRKS